MRQYTCLSLYLLLSSALALPANLGREIGNDDYNNQILNGNDDTRSTATTTNHTREGSSSSGLWTNSPYSPYAKTSIRESTTSDFIPSDTSSSTILSTGLKTSTYPNHLSTPTPSSTGVNSHVSSDNSNTIPSHSSGPETLLENGNQENTLGSPIEIDISQGSPTRVSKPSNDYNDGTYETGMAGDSHSTTGSVNTNSGTTRTSSPELSKTASIDTEQSTAVATGYDNIDSPNNTGFTSNSLPVDGEISDTEDPPSNSDVGGGLDTTDNDSRNNTGQPSQRPTVTTGLDDLDSDYTDSIRPADGSASKSACTWDPIAKRQMGHCSAGTSISSTPSNSTKPPNPTKSDDELSSGAGSSNSLGGDDTLGWYDGINSTSLPLEDETPATNLDNMPTNETAGDSNSTGDETTDGGSEPTDALLEGESSNSDIGSSDLPLEGFETSTDSLNQPTTPTTSDEAMNDGISDSSDLPPLEGEDLPSSTTGSTSPSFSDVDSGAGESTALPTNSTALGSAEVSPEGGASSELPTTTAGETSDSSPDDNLPMNDGSDTTSELLADDGSMIDSPPEGGLSSTDVPNDTASSSTPNASDSSASDSGSEEVSSSK